MEKIEKIVYTVDQPPSIGSSKVLIKKSIEERLADLEACCKYNDELMFIKILENSALIHRFKYLIEKADDALLEIIFYACFSNENNNIPHRFVNFFTFCNDKQKKYILPHILKHFNITLEELLNLLNDYSISKNDEKWNNIINIKKGRYKDFTNDVIESLKIINKTSDGKKRRSKKTDGKKRSKKTDGKKRSKLFFKLL